jgi:hypothetical protein
VGDVAYFLVPEITGIEITAMLPEQVRAEYEEQGVYAYHAFVSRPLRAPGYPGVRRLTLSTEREAIQPMVVAR